MKKFTWKKVTRTVGAGLLAACMTVSVFGCAKKTDPKESTAVPLTTGAASNGTAEAPIEVSEYMVDLLSVNYKDYVDASACKNLVIKKSDVTATEDYVKYQVISTAMKALGAKSVERPVEAGDTITLDYTGYINDIAFQGGSATDATLGIGSGNFIEGFESGLIGKKIGEEISLNVKFPEDYSPEPNYAGKDAVFKVKIKKIETVADADAETVKKKTGFDDYAAYAKSLDENARKEYKESNLWRMYVEQVKEIKEHEGLVKEYQMLNLSMMDAYAMMYGVKRVDILKDMYGFESEDAFLKYMESYAKQYAKQKLAVVAIADVLGMDCTDKDYSDKVAELAKENSISEEEVNKEYTKSDLYFDVIYAKVFDYIYAVEIVED